MELYDLVEIAPTELTMVKDLPVKVKFTVGGLAVPGVVHFDEVALSRIRKHAKRIEPTKDPIIKKEGNKVVYIEDLQGTGERDHLKAIRKIFKRLGLGFKNIQVFEDDPKTALSEDCDPSLVVSFTFQDIDYFCNFVKYYKRSLKGKLDAVELFTFINGHNDHELKMLIRL